MVLMKYTGFWIILRVGTLASRLQVRKMTLVGRMLHMAVHQGLQLGLARPPTLRLPLALLRRCTTTKVRVGEVPLRLAAKRDIPLDSGGRLQLLGSIL